MHSTAEISADGLHRYDLRRVWDEKLPVLVVCMLNPSTADAEKNDPTILALIHFAKLWGYGGFIVVNLRSIRTSSPKLAMQFPVDPENERWQQKAINIAKLQGKPILVAWGNHGVLDFGTSAYDFLELAEGAQIVCLGTTKSGAPKHPMARGKHRIPRTQGAVAWPI